MVSWLRPSTKLIAASSAACERTARPPRLVEFLCDIFALLAFPVSIGTEAKVGSLVTQSWAASDALRPTTEMNISAQLTIKMVSTGNF